MKRFLAIVFVALVSTVLAATPFFKSAVTNTAVLVTPAPYSPVYLASVVVDNTTGAKVYLQLFDAKQASDVTVGTTVPVWVYPIPTGGGVDSFQPGSGIPFNKGIVVAITSTATGAGAPGSAQMVGVTIQ